MEGVVLVVAETDRLSAEGFAAAVEALAVLEPTLARGAGTGVAEALSELLLLSSAPSSLSSSSKDDLRIWVGLAEAALVPLFSIVRAEVLRPPTVVFTGTDESDVMLTLADDASSPPPTFARCFFGFSDAAAAEEIVLLDTAALADAPVAASFEVERLCNASKVPSGTVAAPASLEPLSASSKELCSAFGRGCCVAVAAVGLAAALCGLVWLSTDREEAEDEESKLLASSAANTRFNVATFSARAAGSTLL